MTTFRAPILLGGGATVRPDTAGVPDMSITAVSDGEGAVIGADGTALRTAQTPSTPEHATALANTAVTQTFAAVAGQAHRLTSLVVSYSAAPTGGRVTVAEGVTTLLEVDVTTAGPTVVPLPAGGLKGSVNTAMTVTLAAAGTGVVGKVNTGRITA